MTTRTIRQDVLNRWTRRVQFTADIPCKPDSGMATRLGLAAQWGFREFANLREAAFNGADLSGAILSGADLHGADLSKADLSDSVLTDAQLVGADLRGAVLCDSDLSDANLSDALVEGADFTNADLNGAVPSDAPVLPKIHQTVYAAASAPGAFDMNDWDEGGTTHCRAGWVVALAGEDGAELGRRIGTEAAASLIYLASDPTLDRFPNFHCGNDEALADMKRQADREAALGRSDPADRTPDRP